MKKFKLLGLFIISSLILIGCTNKNSNTRITRGNATGQKISTESTIVSSTKESESVINIGVYTANWSESWNGLDCKINKVHIAEMSPEELAEKGLDNKYIVMVHYIITNNSDKDFNIYPNQGTLVIEGQQVEAILSEGDNLGGEILKGVTKDGVIMYSVKNIENVSNVKNIRLKWPADYSTDNYEEDSYKDFDVTFNLSKI